MKDELLMVLIGLAMIGVLVVCARPAHAQEWRAGVSVTVPLNFQNIGERGTLTVHAESYEVDSYSYSAIDNSIVVVDQSRTTNSLAVTQSTTTNTTNNVKVSGACNIVTVD